MLHKDEMTTYIRAHMLYLFPKQLPTLSSVAKAPCNSSVPHRSFLLDNDSATHSGSSDHFHPSLRYTQKPTHGANIPYIIVSYSCTSASNNTPPELPTALVLAKPAHILHLLADTQLPRSTTTAESTTDYLNRAVHRPITSPWHTSSALNSEPSRANRMSK